MITLVEALGYRCLYDVHRPLGQLQILVGPNASGKTTFLDVIAFLGRVASAGLDAAIEERTQNFQDLLWNRSGQVFELAIEARIPEQRRANLKDGADTIRYELSIGTEKSGETAILAERVLLKKAQPPQPRVMELPFPGDITRRKTMLTKPGTRGTRTVINKVPHGNDNFYSEVYEEKGKGWAPAFKLGPRKSALGNLPADESKFPAATWLKDLLTGGVQPIRLDSLLLRKASPPSQVRAFKPDGSNLPWVINGLQKKAEGRFRDWVLHLRTALPDIESVRTFEREDDRSRYLILCYRGGLEVPSWMASDGTLRLLALTILPYIPGFEGVYMIEEPENGIHPLAVEPVFQSLSSVRDAQILMATHSPVILGIAEPSQVLCFAKSKTPEGAVDIVPGTEHPGLKEWKGQVGLGVLFASGVLG